MSISPLTFTGVSDFSSDFQTILNRAVSIANLPVQLLENQQTDIVQEKMLAGNLSSAVANLATKVAKLGAFGDSKGLTAVSTDSSKVTASISNATAPAYYAITEITSLARTAAETSLSGYADSDTAAVSSTGTLKFTIGTTDHTITLGAGKNNLEGLRDAINALDAGVTATVLATGNGATPYYLSVSADNPGATTLALRDDPTGANTAMLTTANQGANTVFKLNGVTVTKAATKISDVIPDVTLDIKDTTEAGETVGITIESGSSALSSAISELVTAYNAVAQQVSAQIGSEAGLLSGHSMIREVRRAMTTLTQYTNGTGNIRSLAALGIEISQSGEMSYDSTVLNSLSESELNDVFDFLGDSSTGLTSLKTRFTQISDPITGSIKTQIDQWDAADDRITEQVDAMNARIEIMQTGLQAKLQAADTLLAQLASQKSLLTASYDSLYYTTYGRKDE